MTDQASSNSAIATEQLQLNSSSRSSSMSRNSNNTGNRGSNNSGNNNRNSNTSSNSSAQITPFQQTQQTGGFGRRVTIGGMNASSMMNAQITPFQQTQQTGGFGRRVTIGGMNASSMMNGGTGAAGPVPAAAPQSAMPGSNGNISNNGNGARRSSLGFDASLNELFMRRNSGFGAAAGAADQLGSIMAARRSSGFGDLDMLTIRRDSILGGGGGGGAGASMRRDSLFAGSVADRRNSLESNSVVLDAALMGITRRRLSMAMGNTTSMGPPPPSSGDFNSAAAGLGPASMSGADPMMAAAAAAGFPMAGGMFGHSLLGMTHPSNHQSAVAAAGNMPSFAHSQAASISAQQRQVHELQRELDRRKKQLEMEHQQILRGIEEGKMAMSQLQHNLNVNAGPLTPQHLVNNRNHALLMGKPNASGGAGAGGINAGSGAAAGAGGGIPVPGMMAAPPGVNVPHGWIVCQFCNNKAFTTQEEASAHEIMCCQSMRNSAMALQQQQQNAAMNNISFLNNFGGGMGGMNGMDTNEMGAFINANDIGSVSNTAPNPVAPPSPKRRLSLSMMSKSSNSKSQSRRGRNSTDSASNASNGTDDIKMSNGPFVRLPHSRPLSMDSDADWLTPLHCFVRQHCVEIFTASERNVAAPSKGKRKPIQVGQIGIRCPHCHNHDENDEVTHCERGSVYYPTSIASIYNATMNLLQRHLHSCTAVPPEIMKQYETLKSDDARSGTSKKYWIESARQFGLVDTDGGGIRMSAEKPQSASIDSNGAHQQSSTNPSGDTAANVDGKDNNTDASGNQESSVAAAAGSNTAGAAAAGGLDNMTCLVTPEDEPYATKFSFHLLAQMQPCKFKEADRLGKRKGLPHGFSGLACRHCFGGYGSGRFFPSSIKTLSDTSKTLNVLHNHMMRCRKCPKDVRDKLDTLRCTHDDERAKMKFGSQKAFFARIWDRLHGTNDSTRSAPSKSLKRKLEQQQNMQLQAALMAAAATTTTTTTNNFPTNPNDLALALQLQQNAATAAKQQRLS
eukprot:CAMPEP_0119571158 /NCGR_PEP_ID=MMETSP1352-20130426/43976_1 /TAXON_ID=265584 /ORGANISM="Stauroneis constricta, Strain CCMP1120" /LENGTH=1016 /DNA_ID=CAMNT_0007620837 /DNA_START=432 /DNA_END=3482 /DNA_ORIENTATION=+